MGIFVEHARRELELVGMFGADSDYAGELANAVLELVDVFEKQEHSGGSMDSAIELFSILARLNPLTPITSAHSEWIDRSDVSGYPLWQNKRDGRAFSEDGGKTWRVLEAG